MWQYDNSTEIIWKVMFEVNSYGGALGTVFLNYDYTSYKPDYVPAKWALDAYAMLIYAIMLISLRQRPDSLMG